MAGPSSDHISRIITRMPEALYCSHLVVIVGLRVCHCWRKRQNAPCDQVKGTGTGVRTSCRSPFYRCLKINAEPITMLPSPCGRTGRGNSSRVRSACMLL